MIRRCKPNVANSQRNCWVGRLPVVPNAVFSGRVSAKGELLMSDVSDVPQTPFAVALELTKIIAHGEGKPLRTSGTKADGVSKDYVLELYRDCLSVVAGQGYTFNRTQ